MEFTKLKKVYGDLELIIQFFYEYTNKGNELNVPLPKLIIIDMYNEKIPYLQSLSVLLQPEEEVSQYR